MPVSLYPNSTGLIRWAVECGYHNFLLSTLVVPEMSLMPLCFSTSNTSMLFLAARRTLHGDRLVGPDDVPYDQA